MKTRIPGICATLVLSHLLGFAAMAQTVPTKPITIVVPYGPGGASDTLARLSADILHKDFGQPVIVEYKPGAGGTTGLEYVARAAPDGSTLGLTASGSISINPLVYKMRYNPMVDLTPVTILTDVAFVYVVGNEFKARNIEEFKVLARRAPDAVSSGNAGAGSQAHLTQVMFANAIGAKFNIVSYKGSSASLNDLLGGHIDSMIDNTAVQAPYIKAGKVRALFVTSEKRSPALPDVPTAQEAGMPGFSSVAWFGLGAPKGTAPELLAKYQAALAKGFQDPEIRKQLDILGLMPAFTTPAESMARQKADYEKFSALVKQMDLKLQ